MPKLILFVTFVAIPGLVSSAQPPRFLPGHLAVLRAGDGVLDLHLKQSPVFIDQFDPSGFNNAPSATIKIPTNGPETLFFNGHAATEGVLTRSANRRLLAFAGYGGVNLLQSNGTPSLLDIDRGFCTVDSAGTVHTMLYKGAAGMGKMNPRGAVTDGLNNFWGCGNSFGTCYYNPTRPGQPVEFKEVPDSRAIKIINGTLYVSLNGADAKARDAVAGVFAFQSTGGSPALLPESADSLPRLVFETAPPFTKNVDFDINPGGTIGYVSDTVGGVQKYVKSAGSWKFAYNFAIPQVIPKGENQGTGCFGLVVDFNQPAPIIYATTTEGYGGSVNSNRVVRIVDTNSTAVVTTIAQTGSPKIAFRGIEFTPEAGPTKP
jgi:hypothetical protein